MLSRVGGRGAICCRRPSGVDRMNSLSGLEGEEPLCRQDSLLLGIFGVICAFGSVGGDWLVAVWNADKFTQIATDAEKNCYD